MKIVPRGYGGQVRVSPPPQIVQLTQLEFGLQIVGCTDTPPATAPRFWGLRLLSVSRLSRIFFTFFFIIDLPVVYTPATIAET
jgi:hypothetical protein